MSNRTRIAFVAFAATAAFAVLPALASAADGPCYAPPSKPKVISHVKYAGMQSILYCYGPITIRPGQNTNDYTFSGRPGDHNLLPSTPGWITRFDPDLIYADPTKGNHGVPGVDVLHLHHAVWLGMGENDPRWAAGEEKTVVQLPQGYGYRNDPNRSLTINYMIHNLFPTTEHVYLTWRVDFIPDTAPVASTFKRAQTLWLDVAGIKQYPVFDALRGMGSGGKYTFPNQATGAETAKVGSRHEYTAPQGMTLLQTAGHLHPGGLSTTLKATRGSLTKTLFTSKAHYWEPAGAVSWDVAMAGTPSAWRVKLKTGDKLAVSTTYDVSKASWYESMGIMPVAVYFGDSAGGTDWATKSLPQTGVLTHAHLAENNGHGGKTVPHAVNPLLRPNGLASDGSTIAINDFIYGLGDLSNSGASLNPPTVRQGNSFTFRSDDVTNNPYTDYAYHTITSCKSPCNKSTGIAYPRADSAPSVLFDSGQLGAGPEGTASAGRRTWTIPNTLPKGTYSYFCRVHPYMRGAFRVVPR
ncbi:MAG: hypothetical protein F2799_07465 [Actinobacteria bacterium]|uniref:Unannotated protein n=1 Tax=freshwater metagenome TaxID=449393 RepID=A0A6J7ENB4_9ZZZZ|nr:hypothetical protein [Actinomycetota bacterium]